jgi:aldose 1-epimerase
MGSTIGPVANRLRNGRFSIAGESFAIDINEIERSNVLHGGRNGLHQRGFQASTSRDYRSIEFSLTLSHLEDGFPGDRTLTVRYTLTDTLSLEIDFIAKSDRTTIMNLANHAYFNLGGALSGHELKVNADMFSEVDERLLPTGALHSVIESPLDFMDWRRLDGVAIDQSFVLNADSALRHAASLRLASSDLQLDLFTSQPALQIYTGDGLSAPFQPRAGVCLEAQGFPDAPNDTVAPTIELAPGQLYHQRTVYRFGHITETGIPFADATFTDAT